MPIFLLLATIPSFLCGPLPPTPHGSAVVGQLCPLLSTVESSDTGGGTQGGLSHEPSDIRPKLGQSEPSLELYTEIGRPLLQLCEECPFATEENRSIHRGRQNWEKKSKKGS